MGREVRYIEIHFNFAGKVKQSSCPKDTVHTWAISARRTCLQGLCFPHWNLNTLLAQNFLSCVSNTLPRRKWLPARRHHSSVITSVSTNIPTEIWLKVFTQTNNKHTSFISYLHRHHLYAYPTDSAPV